MPPSVITPSMSKANPLISFKSVISGFGSTGAELREVTEVESVVLLRLAAKGDQPELVLILRDIVH